MFPSVGKLVLAALFLGQMAQANLATGKVFGNHMVLQRDVPIPVFGTGTAGEAVTVTLGSATAQGTTDARGSWKVSLPAMPAGGPYSMKIQGANAITYSDVTVGEVWHCAGQSNMDTRMNYSEYPNLADSIKTAKYPNLRYITMRQPGQSIQWQQVSPATVGSMTATGYFFGRHLLDRLDGVAVGIVNTSVGGTIIESWLDPATVAADPILKTDATAGAMYKEWILPVEGFGVRGTVWLQGENNTSSALFRTYGDRLQKLIPGWRQAWGQPDMPFLVAGLCHKGGIQTAAGENSNQAAIRESQRGVTDTMRSTWLSVLVDLGEDGTWHYSQKPQAGARLGLLARGAVWGEKNLVFESPRPISAWKRDAEILVAFDPRGSRLKTSSGGTPTGFEVAGADGVWRWATRTSLRGDTVVLTTDVVHPTQVRHAWANHPIRDLWSEAGLPATPFRMELSGPPISVDCHGTPEGQAAIDSCGRCVGGSTGLAACSSWLEAEEFCSAEGIVESIHVGSHGGYLNLANAPGAGATWVLRAERKGPFHLVFRNANGGVADREASVSVNEQVVATSVSFPSTGAWTSWSTVEVPVVLSAGRNTISILSRTSEGVANLDRIGFVEPGVIAAGCMANGRSRRGGGTRIDGGMLVLGDHSFSSGLVARATDLRGRTEEMPIRQGRVDLRSLGEGVWVVEIRDDSGPRLRTLQVRP
ncbi:MAG: carbohydrate-binding protein [Fibrobacteria bacterium]|nr:carbohydrate-binding protein [Fibrobacteria bacterium]